MKLKKLLPLTLLLIILVLGVASNTFADPGATFLSGNIFQAYNNTKQDTPSWVDPLNNVDPGNVIEYHVRVRNVDDETATGVKVRAEMPDYFGNRQVATIHLTANNASEVTDPSVVNATARVRIDYLPGHARYVDASGEHSLPDTIATSGANLPNLAPGNENEIQVMFKAHARPEPAPTPTPTPSPTPTPTPTPTVTPTPTPTVTPTPTPSPTPTPGPYESRCVGLSASPTEGEAPLAVVFTGSGYDSEGDIQEYEFDFGDGEKITQADARVEHVYQQTGTYWASLRVMDTRGDWKNGSHQCKQEIKVERKPEVLAAAAPPVQPAAGANTGVTLGLIFAGLVGAALRILPLFL